MARNFEHQARELEQNRTGLSAAHAATLNLMEDVVAARDRAETISEALREGEERLRLALDAGHQGIYDVDLTHNTYQTSPEYAQMLGHDPASFAESQEAWLNRTHPEDRQQTHEAFQSCASGQSPEYRIEHRQRTPDGQWKWILSVGRIAAQAPDGKPSRLIGTCTDITEIKNAQETLQQRNEELTRFVYTVSHDLKSPLVTIKTFLGYLENDLRKQDEKRIRSDMDYMSKSTNKMILMLEELLELARAAHKIDSFETFTLQDIAQEAADLVAGAIAQHNVQLDITPTPYQLNGDRRRLLEVFQNLIDNAVKFMGNQPHPRIEITVDDQEEVPVIIVRDNGGGIDPKYQDRIFGLFEKLEPDSPGSGIGLALVQQIIQLHGGRISIHSKGLGHGTAFRFTLAGIERL
jgi:PAS domain S-box-containing protein